MNTTEIRSARSPLYAQWAETYAESFPIFEQRTEAQQAEAFADERYHLEATHADGRLAAFIAWWNLDSCIYVEHFAVEREQRGKGVGSTVLADFCRRAAKPVVLEIDPPEDAVSVARLHFYERLGFRHNAYAHRHPPYRPEFRPHPLHIMSHPEALPTDGYAAFCKELQVRVMKRPTACKNA